jgi:hypothetical protein
VELCYLSLHLLASDDLLHYIYGPFAAVLLQVANIVAGNTRSDEQQAGLPSQTLVTLHLNLFLAQAGAQGAQQPVQWPPVIPSGSNAVNLTRYELKSPVGLRHERSVIFEQADRIFRYSVEMDAVGICAFSSLYSQRKSVATEVVGGEVTAG